MENQELKNYLTTLSRFFATQKASQDTLFTWYWSVLCEYVENHDVLPYSVLQIFKSFCPAFNEHIKAKGYALSEADIVRLEYMQARAPYLATLHKIENASPDILYLKTSEFSCAHSKSPFIPFGKFEEPKEASYFLDALCNADNVEEKTSDVQYAFFKAHIYTNLVHKHLEFFPPSYCYIEEETLDDLRKKYPELAARFETESSEFIRRLGYQDALTCFLQLQSEENRKLSKLTIEQVAKPIKLKVGNRQITIDYEN